MNVRTCYGCPLRFDERRKRCSILSAKLKAVKGLGLTTIDFECPMKKALFVPGQCVRFTGAAWNGIDRKDLSSDGSDNYDEFNGFVMGWRGRKVRVVSEESDRPIVTLYPDKLTPISEPSRRVCIHCGMPEGINIEVKSKGDDKPHPWYCLYDYQIPYTHAPDVWLCEYSEATA